MIDQGLSPRSRSSCLSGPLPYHGRAMLALRPACASWIAGTAPWLLTKSAMRLEAGNVRLVPDARVAVRDAPAALDRGRFDEYDARAAQRELAEVHEVPVADMPVLRRVLAHRRDDDAVARFYFAQCDRLEKKRFAHIEFGVRS